MLTIIRIATSESEGVRDTKFIRIEKFFLQSLLRNFYDEGRFNDSDLKRRKGGVEVVKNLEKNI